MCSFNHQLLIEVPFQTIKNIALLPCCLIGMVAVAQNPGHADRLAGDKAYAKGDYQKAAASYQKAGGDMGHYNAGTALLAQQQHEASASALKSVTAAADVRLRADALFNLGNAYLLMGNWAEAATAYEKSLRLTPNAPDAKRNWQIAKQQQQPPQPPPPPPPPPPVAKAQSVYVDQARTQYLETAPPTMDAATAQRLLEQHVSTEEQRNARRYREGAKGTKPIPEKKNW